MASKHKSSLRYQKLKRNKLEKEKEIEILESTHRENFDEKENRSKLKFIYSLDDILTIESCTFEVINSTYISKSMNHPEYCLSTEIVFTLRKEGPNILFSSTWNTWRTFDEFQAFDHQLRHFYPEEMKCINGLLTHRRRLMLGMCKSKLFIKKRQTELDTYMKSIMVLDVLNLVNFQSEKYPIGRSFCNFDSSIGTNLRYLHDLNYILFDFKVNKSSKHLQPDIKKVSANNDKRLKKLLDEFGLKQINTRYTEPHSSILNCLTWYLLDIGALEILYPSLSRKYINLSTFTFASKQLRELIIEYGLMNANAICRSLAQESYVIELKKQLHSLKNNPAMKIGNIGLRIACCIFNMRLEIIVDGSFAVMNTFGPLAGVYPVRYFSLFEVVILGIGKDNYEDHYYTCAQRPGNIFNQPKNLYETEIHDKTLEKNVDIKNVLGWTSKHPVEANFLQGKTANELQEAILNAIWISVKKDRNRFRNFQCKSLEFIRHGICANDFYTYLEHEFGTKGAEYITDFLVHLVPLRQKRQELSNQRWKEYQKEIPPE